MNSTRMGCYAWIFGVASCTLCSADTKVIPPLFESAEDDGYSGVLGVPIRLQNLYGSGMFSGPISISGLRFRLDAGHSAGIDTMVKGLTIELSTSSQAPDGLSAMFAENVGADALQVFSGDLSVMATAGAAPNAFDIRVPFSLPFLYDPRRGNLLVDIRNAFGAGEMIWVDASNEGDDQASRAFASDPNSPFADWGVDTGCDILQLEYVPVPETSSVAWAVAMAAAGIAFRRLSSRKT